MSPRRHHRRDDAAPMLDDSRARRGVEAVHTWADGAWMVRTVPGDAATKAYRCPGCDQEVAVGVAHVVVWPSDDHAADGRYGWVGGLTGRRHWHTGCWRARDRRTPGR